MVKEGAGKINLKTLLIAVLLVFAVEAALAMMTVRTVEMHLLMLAAARLLQAGALIAAVGILEGEPIAFVLGKVSFREGLKRGALWSAAFGAAALIALAVLAAFGGDIRRLIHARLPAGPTQIGIFMAVGGMLAPVAEEIFFRGILYRYFRRWGVLPALVLSTGLFALAHHTGAALPLTQLVGGILFATAYELEGSLVVPITIHCLGNLSIFTLSIVF